MIKKINEKYKHSGDYLLIIKKNNTVKDRFIIENQITKYARDEICKPLYGTAADIEIGYIAFGDGTTTPTEDDQTLSNEVYRVNETSLGKYDFGQVLSEFVLTGLEYTAVQPSGVINEIGIFGGSSAAAYGGGAGIDTGLLISRVSWTYTLASDESIFIQRFDNITA